MIKVIETKFPCKCKECECHIGTHQKVKWNTETKAIYCMACCPNDVYTLIEQMRKVHQGFIIELVEAKEKSYIIKKIRKDGSFRIDEYTRSGNYLENGVSIGWTKSGA